MLHQKIYEIESPNPLKKIDNFFVIYTLQAHLTIKLTLCFENAHLYVTMPVQFVEHFEGGKSDSFRFVIAAPFGQDF